MPLWQQMHALLAASDLHSDAHLAGVQAAYLRYVEHRQSAVTLIATGLKERDGAKVQAGSRLLKDGNEDIEQIKRALAS